MPGEVSDQEIERELTTLRSLRRRSVTSAGPGALPLDPDLPPEASHSYSSNDDITLASPDGLDGENAGLFWVPAHLHPELAPGEFRAFLKSHTHPDPTGADATEAAEAPGLSRSPSWLSRNPSRRGAEGLGRKRSMLSRQYQPTAGDNVEEERPPLPSRGPLSIYSGRSAEKGLTLQDLQKLEEIVDEAEEDDDPASMRKLLRRSLSTNVAPGFLHDDVPQGDEGDAPIIPPRPGSILRRSARTKIRKAGLAGDGGGHRFAATRKGRMTAAPQREIPGLEDDDYPEGHQHGGSDEGSQEQEETFHDAPQHLEERRGSDVSTDENNIFDAYARNSRSSSMSSESRSQSESPSPESSPPGRKLSLPPLVSNEESDWFASDTDKTPTQELVSDPLAGRRRPSPGSEFSERPAFPLLSSGGPSLQVPQDPLVPRPASPSAAQQKSGATPGQYELLPGMAPPVQRATIPPGIAMQQKQQQPAPAMSPVTLERPQLARVDSAVSSTSSAGTKEKEKEKKGGFFSKKDKKDKEGKSKKDKDGFLGSLFGGTKKKQEEVTSVASFSAAGPATAAALLGSSRSAKAIGAPPSPSPSSNGFSSFARYPIHVERAVYRLSHIKLANARRPLYEQVLISNLMFWYLGVIGRNVNEEKKAGSSNPEDKKEETKVVIKGTPPRPADSGSAGKLSPASRQPLAPIETSFSQQASSPATSPAATNSPSSPISPISGKKTSLSKPERARDGRNNEAPMRAPQYGKQNAQVDHELRSGAPPMRQLQPPPPQQPQQQRPSQQGPPHPHPQGYGGPPYPNHPQQQQQQHPHQQHVRPNAVPSPKGPPRTLSPPSNGPVPNGPPFPHAAHPGVRGPPGGVPQSSFGPPPPNGPGPLANGDMRQRTMSNPTPPPGPSTAGMRRVVTDGRAPPDLASPVGGNVRPVHAQHTGPQPGQIFQYPGAAGPVSPFQQRPSPSSPPPGSSPGTQPGQIFSLEPPQPGQIYHSQQRPPQQQQHFQHQRPPQQYAPRPLPQHGHSQSQGGVAGNWEPPQRLPPGASPPPQQWQGHGQQRPLPQGQGYDPRRGPSPSQQTPYSPLQAFYNGPPQGQGQGPVQQGQRPPLQAQAQAQPGQVYGGYPAAGGYGHHR